MKFIEDKSKWVLLFWGFEDGDGGLLREVVLVEKRCLVGKSEEWEKRERTGLTWQL